MYYVLAAFWVWTVNAAAKGIGVFVKCRIASKALISCNYLLAFIIILYHLWSSVCLFSLICNSNGNNYMTVMRGLLCTVYICPVWSCSEWKRCCFSCWWFVSRNAFQVVASQETQEGQEEAQTQAFSRWRWRQTSSQEEETEACGGWRWSDCRCWRHLYRWWRAFRQTVATGWQ